ncbi:MAG: Nramp family divalent metal transporter [Candidatus Saccharimonadales bacterium]
MPKATKKFKTLSLLGPAFVAAIAYVDPGNFASNLTAGSEYGYLLLWVVVAANLMAGLVQYLSAKVGLVTGQSLPELVRHKLPKRAIIMYWLQAELVAAATDIAEVLGGAIALKLLFNLPLIAGGLIAGLASILLLMIQGRRGQKTFERVMFGLLLIIPIGFIAGLILRPAHVNGLLQGLIPGFRGQNSLLLATSILGATVMPHVIYLHSALARDRHGRARSDKLKSLLKTTKIDVGLAMLIAGGVNIAMLLLAAAALRGAAGTSSLAGAYQAFNHFINPLVATLFAVGLLVSGLASTSVGCYAGSVIMGGLMRRQIPIIVRRLITLLPALTIIAAGVSPTKALVLSQVVLSFGIPLAIIPLVKLTNSKKIMGEFVNRRLAASVAWLATAAIMALDCLLVVFVF